MPVAAGNDYGLDQREAEVKSGRLAHWETAGFIGTSHVSHRGLSLWIISFLAPRPWAPFPPPASGAKLRTIERVPGPAALPHFRTSRVAQTRFEPSLIGKETKEMIHGRASHSSEELGGCAAVRGGPGSAFDGRVHAVPGQARDL